MHLTLPPLSPALPLLLLLAGAASAQFPCTAPRPVGICAYYVRPYSDEAYVLGTACGIPVPPGGPGTLMASDVEFYDPEYGW